MELTLGFDSSRAQMATFASGSIGSGTVWDILTNAPDHRFLSIDAPQGGNLNHDSLKVVGFGSRGPRAVPKHPIVRGRSMDVDRPRSESSCTGTSAMPTFGDQRGRRISPTRERRDVLGRNQYRGQDCFRVRIANTDIPAGACVQRFC